MRARASSAPSRVLHGLQHHDSVSCAAVVLNPFGAFFQRSAAHELLFPFASNSQAAGNWRGLPSCPNHALKRLETRPSLSSCCILLHARSQGTLHCLCGLDSALRQIRMRHCSRSVSRSLAQPSANIICLWILDSSGFGFDSSCFQHALILSASSALWGRALGLVLSPDWEPVGAQMGIRCFALRWQDLGFCCSC